MKEIMTEKIILKYRHFDSPIGTIDIPKELVEKFKEQKMFYRAPGLFKDSNGNISLTHLSICLDRPVNEELKMREIDNDDKS